MAITIRKASRKQALLRLGLSGPSGSGKTMSALKMARGVSPEGTIVMIDTERGSGDLYSDLYDYDIITLEPPFKPEKYIEAIKAAEIHILEQGKGGVVIVDSLSHAWSEEGGILDQADKLQKSNKNKFTVWKDLTPQHRRLVNALLDCKFHLIATVRAKQAYAMEQNEKGQNTVRKMGLAPVQREGMEYEFTIFFDIDQGHNATASKDRTSMFKDEVFTIDEDTGKRVLDWLESGEEVKEDPMAEKKKIFQNLKRLGFALGKDEKAGQEARTIVEVLTDEDIREESRYAVIVAKLEAHSDPVKAQNTVKKFKDAAAEKEADEQKAPEEDLPEIE